MLSELRNVAAVLLIGLVLASQSACSRTSSEKRTTVVTEDPHTDDTLHQHSTTTTTTETTETDDSGCGGVLSCTVDVIGDILAFPFKVVGALIGAVF